MGAYYGSLRDFTTKRLTIKQISTKFRIPWSTVKRIIVKFEASGKSLEAVHSKKPRHFNCIKDENKEKLLSQDLLQTWAPYSILERTKLIQAKLGFTVSDHTLWQFYQANGIKIRTGQAVYRQFIDQSLRVMGERAAFSRLIGNLMIAKPHQLIWMDETTYSSVQMKAKSWSRKQDPVLHAKNNRQMRVTVFGAIGTCLQNGRVMRLAKSTNKQDFMSFLVDIKTSILPKYRSQKQILLFDGARAHTCHDSQAFM